MARRFIVLSIILLVATAVWLCYAFYTDPIRWQFLAAGGLHFIWSMIINRQYTTKNTNYLGIVHTIVMIMLFAYGYIML